MEQGRIRKRRTTSGKTKFDVKWRPEGRGGRDFSRTFSTLQEARVFAASLLLTDEAFLPEPTPRVTITQVFQRFRELKEASGRSPKTLSNYDERFRYLKPLWETSVDEVTTAMLNDFYTGLRNDKGPNVAWKVQELLRQILALAVDEGLLEANPNDRAMKFSAPKGNLPVMLTQEQFKRLEAQIPRFHLAAFYLLSMLGLRHGEVDGLTLDCFAEDFSTVTIKQTYQQGLGFGAPKTAKSNRRLVVPKFIRPLIAERVPGPDGRLFCLDHNFGRKVLAPACERAGVPRLVPHNLRDHCASTLLASGLDLGSVSRVLGHASVVITGTRYIATLDNASERAADLMETLNINSKD